MEQEEFDLRMERGSEGTYYSSGSLPIVSILYAFKSCLKTSETRVLSFARSCHLRDSRAAYTCLL